MARRSLKSAARPAPHAQPRGRISAARRRASLSATHARLVRAAVRARRQAYAPYSQFPVGAAVLAADGTIYTGCNVENASYGLALCAERVAIHGAVAAGRRRLIAVAVAGPAGITLTPCGACRQVMEEFGVRTVILAAPRGAPAVVAFPDLLPAPFTRKWTRAHHAGLQG